MEKLYNGIELPASWPPRYEDTTSSEPMKVPYLENPPKIITVDIGRQLFVDDFLIEKTTLTTGFHKAVKFADNPVFYPETDLENGGGNAALPCAAPKSGGVWWDKKDKIYKMWYEAGWLNSMAYATSADGIHWNRPCLDIDGATNRILPGIRPDSTAVFIDEESEAERYKLFLRSPGGCFPGIVATSADGINWNNLTYTSRVNDRSTIFYNPFRKKWVYSIRSNLHGKRARDYREHSDFIKGATWNKEEEFPWLETDRFDRPDPAVGFAPQLYNLDAVAYESIMLGLFQIHLGPENDVCEKTGIPKITELIPMYSRDGFHWSRPSREAFIRASRDAGEWDRGYVQSVGGVCAVVGDELWFYYIGFKGDEENHNTCWTRNGMYANGATGIAKLRRDGFVSMNAENSGGELITRPLLFHDKKYLFVNFKGNLKIEILGEDGKPIEPYTMENALTLRDDSTKAMVCWKDGPDVSQLSGIPIRLRFSLKSGELYSFWLSETEEGKSNGYPAAGGPLA